MKLEGIHHVTCITGDAPRNVEYYAGTLGLRASQVRYYDGLNNEWEKPPAIASYL